MNLCVCGGSNATLVFLPMQNFVLSRVFNVKEMIGVLLSLPVYSQTWSKSSGGSKSGPKRRAALFLELRGRSVACIVSNYVFLKRVPS